MVLADCHFFASKVAYALEKVTARQNDVEGHDTEIIPLGPAPLVDDQRCPSKIRDCPSRLTATQNFGVAHETSRMRLVSAPLPRTCAVDHVLPSNVPIVLAAPGVPAAPETAQKVTVGHDTS